MSDHTTLPAVEAVIRTPLGDVRCWIDAEGAVRTSLNAQLGGGMDPAVRPQALAVADQAARAIRALFGCEAATPANPGAFSEWFAERVQPDDDARTRSVDFYEDYLAWCEKRSLRALSIRQFGDALSDRNGPPVKDRYGYKVRRGLRLKPRADGPALKAVV